MNCQNCGKEWTITQEGWLVCEGENFCSQECADDYGGGVWVSRELWAVECEHDWQIIESDTVDVGEPSEWCPKCGFLRKVIGLEPEEDE